MLAPVIAQIAVKYEGTVKVGKVDVDENNDLATRYGIRNIPTVLFFKDGELVDKQVGAGPRPMFEAKINALL